MGWHWTGETWEWRHLDLTELFYAAQDAVQSGDIDKAEENIVEIDREYKAEYEGSAYSAAANGGPPAMMVTSMAHNTRAEMALDRALDDGFPLRAFPEETLREAEAHLERALSVNPWNTAALMNSAMLARDLGDADKAAEHWRRASCRPPSWQDPDCSDDEDEVCDGWREAWLVDPYEKSVALACMYRALLLCQLGEHADADRELRRFGFRWKLAPGVWDLAAGRSDGIVAGAPGLLPPPPPPPLRLPLRLPLSGGGHGGEAAPSEEPQGAGGSGGAASSAAVAAAAAAAAPWPVPVRQFANAVAPGIYQALRRAFAPEAAYWRETQYENASASKRYFTFYVDLPELLRKAGAAEGAAVGAAEGGGGDGGEGAEGSVVLGAAGSLPSPLAAAPPGARSRAAASAPVSRGAIVGASSSSSQSRRQRRRPSMQEAASAAASAASPASPAAHPWRLRALSSASAVASATFGWRALDHNVVERLLLRLWPLLGRPDLTSCEWWVHQRAAGRSWGHELHFDVEERTMEITGRVVHPAVSSVVYLSEHGDPTIVLDETIDKPLGAQRVFAAHPRERSFLAFDGRLLHGVLPGPFAHGAPRGPPQPRLTLLIAWYCEPTAAAISPGASARAGAKLGAQYGAQSRVPRASRHQTWPSDLEMRPEELALDDEACMASAAAASGLPTDGMGEGALGEGGGQGAGLLAPELPVPYASPAWIPVPPADLVPEGRPGKRAVPASAYKGLDTSLDGPVYQTASCPSIHTLHSHPTATCPSSSSSQKRGAAGGLDQRDGGDGGGSSSQRGSARDSARGSARDSARGSARGSAKDKATFSLTPREIVGRTGRAELLCGEPPTALAPPETPRQHFFLVEADEVGARLRTEHGQGGTWAEVAVPPGAKRPRRLGSKDAGSKDAGSKDAPI